jgi:o-succinylbenzoate---CoA ligase
VNSLIALDLAGGQRFVDELSRAWDNGDAILPIDQRLAIQAKRALMTQMRASQVIDETGSTSLEGGQETESDDALVVATSGTTGQAKGVVLTHAAVLASALASSRALEVDVNDHWLACLPLCHVGGLSVVTTTNWYRVNCDPCLRCAGSDSRCSRLQLGVLGSDHFATH